MLDILQTYYEKGLLHKQVHPSLDLTIWNYTPKVQYEKLWDEITLECRGLITNSEGKIVARPFKKFFNYEEHSIEDIPDEPFEIYEKMDGSLGIVFYYERELTLQERIELTTEHPLFDVFDFGIGVSNDEYDHAVCDSYDIPKTIGEWYIATRGSFVSQQAIKGKEILNQHDISKLDPNYTYLFEIIYPENRIVVDYVYEDLILLGVINAETGEEQSLHLFENIDFNIVKRYTTWGENWDTLKSEIQNDREGYVVRFRNGFRMKIKGNEYIRLHKILTNISNRDIWEYLKDNKSMSEILDKVPDEFYDWVKYTKERLEDNFKKIEAEYEWIYKVIKRVDGASDKKVFAEHALKYKYPSILFNMNTGKDYRGIIWKITYPDYSKPFKKNEE